MAKHTEQYELIVSKSKKMDNYLILREATLITKCTVCDKSKSEYVLGGVVFDEGKGI